MSLNESDPASTSQANTLFLRLENVQPTKNLGITISDNMGWVNTFLENFFQSHQDTWFPLQKFGLFTPEFRVRLVTLNIFKPSSNLFTDSSKAVLLLCIFFVIYVCFCCAVLSVHCSLVITCWARAKFLALLCVMFSCAFLTLPYGVLGQMRCLIVFIPDLCLLYFAPMITKDVACKTLVRHKFYAALIWSPYSKLQINQI